MRILHDTNTQFRCYRQITITFFVCIITMYCATTLTTCHTPHACHHTLRPAAAPPTLSHHCTALSSWCHASAARPAVSSTAATRVARRGVCYFVPVARHCCANRVGVFEVPRRPHACSLAMTQLLCWKHGMPCVCAGAHAVGGRGCAHVCRQSVVGLG